MKTIWIDIDNLPHVLIFRYLIKELAKDFELIVTVRDHAFSCELMDELSLPYIRVGRHYGKKMINKVAGTVWRAEQLRQIIVRQNRPCLAVSHGSRSMVLSAAKQSIPALTFLDYEYVSDRVFELFSKKILVPELVKESPHFQKHSKYAGYPGFKEELYLCRFRPDPGFLQQMGWPTDKVRVVLRPPATLAHYHDKSSETIFQRVLEKINQNKNLFGILAPRTKSDIQRYSDGHSDNFLVLARPIPGLDLIYHADLVIGGGGTMNREAGLLGVPVYSIFQGQRGVLDQTLVQAGKMVFIENMQQTDLIRWSKRQVASNPVLQQEVTLQHVLQVIRMMANEG